MSVSREKSKTSSENPKQHMIRGSLPAMLQTLTASMWIVHKFCSFDTRVLRHKGWLPEEVWPFPPESLVEIVNTSAVEEPVIPLKKLCSVPFGKLTPSITWYSMQKQRRTWYRPARLYRVGKENG